MRPETRERPGDESGAAPKVIAATKASVAQSTDDPREPRAAFQPMPELTPEQYDALKADIAARGIVVPVVADQHGRIIDGHNRSAIAAELSIECPRTVRQVADDDEAGDLAVTLNCARRHLTREQVRAVIAGELERRPGDSDRAVARRVGCSPSTVGAVRGPQVSKLDTTSTRAELAKHEAVIDAALDNAPIHHGADGRPLTRPQAMFALYVWALHLDKDFERMRLAAVGEDGVLKLYCGGPEGGCPFCHRAIEADPVDMVETFMAAGR